MNAERGHANIQGNTDNAQSWDILPGYLAIPKPGTTTIDESPSGIASRMRPRKWSDAGCLAVLTATCRTAR